MYRIIAIGCVALGLSACTVERVVERPASPDSTTAAPETSTVDAPMTIQEREDMVIAYVIETYGSMPNTKDEVLQTAYLVCDNLKAGVTVDEFTAMIDEASDTLDAANYLIAITAGAMAFLCPEYMPEDY